MVAVAGLAGAAVSAWLAVLVAMHGAEAVYVLRPTAVVIGVLGGVAAMAGWGIVAWRRDGVVLGAVLAGCLVVAGVLSILSVGILVIPAAIATIIGVQRVAQRRPPEDERALVPWIPLAVALVASGLPAAALVAADGPSVSCREHGVVTRSSIFGSSGNFSSSSRANAAGNVSTGTFTTDGRTYRYRCVGTHLEEFVTVGARTSD
jgi:hypothetical protein